jgi:hypothetical protein
MKRLSISKGAKRLKETRPELRNKLPKTGDLYINFKNATVRLCDDIIKDDISAKQKSKVAWLRSRIIIEM